MGGLSQQINLYRGQEAANATSAGARLLLISGVGALFAVVMLAIAGEFYLSGLQADQAMVAKNLRAREAALAKFQETLTVPAIDPFLEAELAGLRETRHHLNANLTAIARHSGAAQKGFSDLFGGLARNTLEGLWLQNVGVSGGGAEMLLRGQAIEPELVPRLLQTLAAERAFSGRTFRKVNFERREVERGTVVDFELRSAQSAEVGDAG